MLRESGMGWNITDAGKLEDAIFEMKFKLAQKIGVLKGMTVVDVGCGQGGFTVSVARIVGENGRVLSVDVSEEYLAEFMGNLDKWRVGHLVTFIRKDAIGLGSVAVGEPVDMVVSCRFLEELKRPDDMASIVKEMTRVVKKGGKVCIVELSTRTRNEAEKTYVRLHRESGDSLFEPREVVRVMKEAGLDGVCLEEFATDIWFSPELAKQDLGFAQVWFDAEVERSLGKLIELYGMKYPPLVIFTGVRDAPQQKARS